MKLKQLDLAIHKMRAELRRMEAARSLLQKIDGRFVSRVSVEDIEVVRRPSRTVIKEKAATRAAPGSSFKAIKKALSTGRPLTWAALRAAAGLAHGSFNSAVQRMAKQGLIKRVGNSFLLADAQEKRSPGALRSQVLGLLSAGRELSVGEIAAKVGDTNNATIMATLQRAKKAGQANNRDGKWFVVASSEAA